jgi:hypothetical protein
VPIVLALALAQSRTAAADGGRICASETVGSLVLTIFSSPTPLRVGMADVSVLVQDAVTGAPRTDASVWIALQQAGSVAAAMEIEASPGASANRLLYAASLRLASDAPLAIHARVRTADAEASLQCAVEVVAAEPLLLAHWPLVVLPPAAVLLYAVHQWLHYRQRRRRAGTEGRSAF